MDIYKTEEFKDFYFKTSEYKPLKSITCLRGFYCFCFNLVLWVILSEIKSSARKRGLTTIAKT